MTTVKQYELLVGEVKEDYASRSSVSYSATTSEVNVSLIAVKALASG
jgi:hypothetical protein